METYLPPDLAKAVERARGIASRAAYIRQAVIEKLGIGRGAAHGVES